MSEGDVERGETYDLDGVLAWLLGQGLGAEDIVLVKCGTCGELTPYVNGDSRCCACQAQVGEVEERMSLAQYWESQIEENVLW